MFSSMLFPLRTQRDEFEAYKREQHRVVREQVETLRDVASRAEATARDDASPPRPRTR